MLVAGSVLLALVALLAVPLELAFRLEGATPLAGEVTVRWLFGLVRARVPVPGERGRQRRSAKRARRRSRAGPGRAMEVLRQGAFRRRAWRLAGDLLRAVHVRRLRVRARFGLDDPADTGMLWAVMGPLSAMAGGLRRAEVRLDPEFAEAALEFQAEGRVVVVPLQVLALAAAFALSPPSMRAWRTLAGGHG